MVPSLCSLSTFTVYACLQSQLLHIVCGTQETFTKWISLSSCPPVNLYNHFCFSIKFKLLSFFYASLFHFYYCSNQQDYDPYEENPGIAPFSEPEAQIMRKLAISFEPHIWVNVHSGMEVSLVHFFTRSLKEN